MCEFVFDCKNASLQKKGTRRLVKMEPVSLQTFIDFGETVIEIPLVTTKE